MKYGRRFLLLLCLLSCLCLVVGAVDVLPDDTTVPDLEPTVPKVALDDETLQALVDALVPIEPDGDVAPSDSEPTVPSVILDPESVNSIAEAMGEVLADAAAPEVAVNFANSPMGGYYFVADCALGRNMKFWVPADFASDALASDGNGLINMTNTNIYIVADDSSYSDYIIYAPRFGHFQYRRNSSSSGYQDLAISGVFDSNISFLQDTPHALPGQSVAVLVVVLLAFGILALCFLARR